MSTIRTFKDIKAWGKAVQLAKWIYHYSGTYPFSKDKELVRQIRKATNSVASNIAEGFEREGNKEFIQFLTVAKGSAGEVQTQVCIAHEVGYLGTDEFNQLDELCTEVICLIAGFIRYLRTSSFEGQKFNRN